MKSRNSSAYRSTSARNLNAVRPKEHSVDEQPIKTRKHAPDYGIVVIIALLLVVGAIIGYTSSPGLTEAQGLPSDFYTKKQLIASGIGVVAFIIAATLKLDFWRKIIGPAVVFAVISALAVRLFGTPIYGAYRWLDIGGVSVQAAEIIKFALVLWLSHYVYRMQKNNELFLTQSVKLLIGVLLAIMIVVAGLQSDFGSAAVMIAMLVGVLYSAGMPMKHTALAAVGIISLLGIFIFTSSYRVQRLETFVNPSADCENTGYQVCQALISVGSGGIFGRGLGKSVQAYGYLPEALSDSIFAVIAENFGFFGAAFVVLLYLELFRRLYRIAVALPHGHYRYMVLAILLWIASQTMINIGAMVGLLPLKGITLPLVSFGGTSIIFVLAALGICFNASRYTDIRAARVAELKSVKKSKQNDDQPGSNQRSVYRRR